MKQRHIVLLLLFLLSIITYVDRVCIAVAGPRMQQDLGITPELWGWVVGVFAISYAAFEIPSGALGDRIGPRKVLARIVVWWSVFTSLTGAVSSYGWLLVARFMFGAGEAGAYPNSSSTISRWFPAVERAWAHGLVWMASRLGGAISPLLVIPIQTRWGWRASFWIFGIVGCIWAWVWYWWFRNTPAEKPSVTEAELNEIGAGPPAKHESLPWRRVLRNRNFLALLLMYHTYCWGAYFFISWMPTFLAQGRGFSEADLKTYSWIPFCFGALANLAGGFVSDRLVRRVGLRWGRRIVGLVGQTTAAVFMLATVLTDDKLTTVIFLGFALAGSDFMLPVAWAVCLDVGRKYAGAVSGAMNTAGQIGSFLTSVVFGYLVGAFGSYNAPLVPGAAMLLVSAALWLKIDPTEQLVKEPVTQPVGAAA